MIDFLAVLSLHKERKKADSIKYLEQKYKRFIFLSITMLILDIAWNVDLVLILQYNGVTTVISLSLFFF